MNKLIAILQILIYITYLAELLPFILCLVFFKKIKATGLKVFFLYSATFAFFLCLSIYFRIFLQDSPHQLLINRFFLVTEFSFLSLFYNYTIVNKLKKTFFLFCVTAFILYSFYDYSKSKAGQFSFIPLVIECLFFLLVIIYFFYEKIKYNVSASLYYYPDFWISVGFLIYFSGNFFLFLFSKSMFNDPDFRFQYTIIYGFVTIIKNVFICMAIVVNANIEDQASKANKIIDIDLGTFNPLTKSTNL